MLNHHKRLPFMDYRIVGGAVVLLAFCLLIYGAPLVGTLVGPDHLQSNGHGVTGNPTLAGRNLLADLITGIAYLIIPVMLFYIVGKARYTLPFKGTLLAFGLFIIACGVNHLLHVWTRWLPHYELQSAVMVFMALVSVATAVALPPIVPQALALVANAELAEGHRSELKRVNQELQREHTLLQTLMDTIPDAIYFKDQQGRFIHINQAQARNLGIADGSALGKTDFDFFGGEHAEEARLDEERILTSGTPMLDRIEHYSGPDGRWVWISATKAPILDADRQPVGIVGISRDITERMEIEASLREREQQFQTDQRFRVLAEAIPQIVWTANPDGMLDYYNQRWYDYTGMTIEQSQGGGWQPVLHPDDLEPCLKRWTHAYTTGAIYEVEYRFKRASDGAYRWHLGRAMSVRDADGRIIKWFGTCTDIEDQKRAMTALRDVQQHLEVLIAERTSALQHANSTLHTEIAEREWAEHALRESQERFHTTFVYAAIGMALVALDGRWLDVNPALCELTGYAEEELLQRTFQDITHQDDLEADLAYVQQLLAGDIRSYHLEKRYLHQQGHHIWVLLSVSLVRDEAGVPRYFIAQIEDISDRKQVEEALRELSVRDPLTGLFNRRYLEETLEREVHRARRNGLSVGTLMLDIDHFKRFNDTFGHAAGDALLRNVGQLLRRYTRREDIACRYGGEEFCIILPGATSDIVLERAKTIRAAVAELQVQHLNQQLGQITCTIGVALFPQHGLSLSEVIEAADQALYQAKHAGRNHVMLATNPAGGDERCPDPEANALAT